MHSFTTHSSLETHRLRYHVTNIVIHCKTLHNPTLVVCYSYSKNSIEIFYQALFKKNYYFNIIVYYDGEYLIVTILCNLAIYFHIISSVEAFNSDLESYIICRCYQVGV